MTKGVRISTGLCLVAGIIAAPVTAQQNYEPNKAANREALVGTYRLISTTQKIVDTGEVQALSNERGFITYTKEGRMLVIIVRGERKKPESLAAMTDQQRADLFRSLTAYSGTYEFDGKTVIHNIDISWNEAWTGTRQVRHFRREGNRVILETPAQPRPADGKVAVSTLTWERMESH